MRGEITMTNGNITTAIESAKKAKNRISAFAERLSDITIKNKADIDFEIKSGDKIKPLFSFKRKFDKEFSLLPVIGIALSVILFFMLLSDLCAKKQCDCGDDVQ